MTTTPTWQTARKEHACDWCGEKIEVGQRYRRWRWFDGGDTSVVKAHEECNAAWVYASNESVDEVRAGGDQPRGVWQDEDNIVWRPASDKDAAWIADPLTVDGDCSECFAGIKSGDGHNEGCSRRDPEGVGA